MKLTSVAETYSQEEDCCGRPEVDIQDLTISTEDGGGGSYLVLKTKRWALDGDEDIETLVTLLKKILARIET